jgi:uncharacterized OB-fold protein
MTLLGPQRGAIASPHASDLSQPFWYGCALGELRFQRCDDCGLATHTPAYLCAHCASQRLSWERSAGTGTIYSWTIVWRPQSPAFEVPYAPVIVDVDEGWQILSNVIGCEPGAIAVGLRVTVEFHATESGFSLPYFRVDSPR